MADLGPVLDEVAPVADGDEQRENDVESGKDAEGRPSRRRMRLRRPLYLLQDPLDSVRNFSPSLFILSSTTGLQGLLWALCPYFGEWALDVAFAIWWLSLFFFVALCFFLVGRFALLRKEVHQIAVSRDADLFFFALVPIAFVIVVEGFAKYMPHYFGPDLDLAGISLWWVGWVMSLGMMMLIPFHLAQFSCADLKGVLPLWVLMCVPGAATAAVGGELTTLLSEQFHSSGRHIVYGTWIILGLSTAIAGVILTVLVHRLLLHGFPPHGFIISLFFPVAPLALLGDAYLELAVGMPRIFPASDASLPVQLGSEAISTGCILIALSIFGFTLWWMFMALLAISFAFAKHRHFPYTPAWWGAAFPVGLNGLLAIRLGDVLHVEAFWIVGCALSLISFAAWFVTFCATTFHAYSGRIFIKPGTRTN